MSTLIADREPRSSRSEVPAGQVRHHEKPALVFDTDDTTLWTYDMEVAAMHFNFDPTLQNVWVQNKMFPATPGMVAFVNKAAATGLHRLRADRPQRQPEGRHHRTISPTVGYTAFTLLDNVLHEVDRQRGSQQPSYITCAAASCTTVEYKAGTREAHREVSATPSC